MLMAIITIYGIALFSTSARSGANNVTNRLTKLQNPYDDASNSVGKRSLCITKSALKAMHIADFNIKNITAKMY